MFCAGAIPEILAGTNALNTICEQFRVYIGRQAYERMKAEMAGSLQMQYLADWLDMLISRLTTGIDSGQYQLIVIRDESKKDVNGLHSENPLEGCIGILLGFEISEGDPSWTDDRWLNSYRHRDGVPIVDIIDILKLLVGLGEMSRDEYYRLLSRLRYLPTSSSYLCNWMKSPINLDKLKSTTRC